MVEFGSEKSGGGLTVVQNLTGPTEVKGFTTFYCGKEKTGSIKVNVKGHILIKVEPVIAAPNSKLEEPLGLGSKGETHNEEQPGIAGCAEAEGKSQAFMFIKGEGVCQFLKVTENNTELEPSVNFGTNEVKYGTKKIELVGS